MFNEVVEVSSTCAKKAAELGMNQLNCYFTTLYEVSGLIKAHYSVASIEPLKESKLE